MPKASDLVTGDLTLGQKRVTRLPTEIPGSESDAVRLKQVAQLIIVATTNNGTTPSGPKYLANKRYVDAKNVGMRAAVILHADQKGDADKSYVNEQDAVVRSASLLQAGDVVIGDLTMGGRRVTGLHTGASTSESMAQIVEEVTDTITTNDRVPTQPLRVNNK